MDLARIVANTKDLKEVVTTVDLIHVIMVNNSMKMVHVKSAQITFF